MVVAAAAKVSRPVQKAEQELVPSVQEDAVAQVTTTSAQIVVHEAERLVRRKGHKRL